MSMVTVIITGVFFIGLMLIVVCKKDLVLTKKQIRIYIITLLFYYFQSPILNGIMILIISRPQAYRDNDYEIINSAFTVIFKVIIQFIDVILPVILGFLFYRLVKKPLSESK